MSQITYTSSAGETFDLMAFRLPRIMSANFHTFSWKPDTTARQYGEKVTRWRKEALTLTASILFAGKPDARKKALNAFHAAIDGDFFRGEAGTLTWDGSYIKAFVQSSSTYPDDMPNRTINEIEIYCPYPFWVQEQRLEIEPVESSVVRETDKQYTSTAYGYPYSYATSSVMPKLVIDHYADCDFRLEAFGVASDVAVTIGGHTYSVDHSVSDGEKLVIDSRQDLPADRHCYLVGTDGSITNCFDDRDPESFLLQKIKPGANTISYTRAYKIILTIYKERSEPAWTTS